MAKVSAEAIKTHIKKFSVILDEEEVKRALQNYCYGLFGAEDSEVYAHEQTEVKIELEIARNEYIVECAATMEFAAKEQS